MDFLQLKYFQVTSKHENVTRAADELFISQPALSKMIRNLEMELGVQLFDREGKHIVLNQYGKKFLKRVNQSLSALEQGVSEIKEMQQEKIEIITLYVAVGSMLLPSLVQQFRGLYSNIRFNLTQHPIQIKKELAYDFAITSEEIEGNEHTVLLEEEILLGVPAVHPLSSLDSVSLKELEHEKFISLTTSHPLRRTTDRFFAQLPYEPDIVFESDDPATVRGLIQTGIGVSFIPSILWSKVVTEDIKLLHISEPRCKRTIYLSWPAGERLTDTENSFFEFILQFFRNIGSVLEE
ncbi:LysR family transcriptional regulator [Paenibacillus macerans]|uniref:LysR family transcriptional regulator n=1 Tax=Paenibacillus macerans TaxID=44252 RepID=UPI00203BB68A|nr:LysR family transcriptional regulator [Paenibacillus macerans]MCM3698720.1 LysR family transcriptional regulator [Paenibacillus macerans]